MGHITVLGDTMEEAEAGTCFLATASLFVLLHELNICLAAQRFLIMEMLTRR